MLINILYRCFLNGTIHVVKASTYGLGVHFYDELQLKLPFLDIKCN